MFHKIFPVFFLIFTGCHYELPLEKTTLKASADSPGLKAAHRCTLCYSTDQGRTWQPDEAGLPAKVNVWRMIQNGDQLLIATDEHGLFMTDREQKNWQAIKTNQLPSTNITAIAAEGDAIYVAVDKAGLYATHDGGLHWDQLNKNPLSDEDFIHAIFKVGNELWVAQRDGLFAMSEAPVNEWRELMQKTYVSKLVQIDGRVLLGTNQGIAMSSNGGDNWVWLVKGRFVNKLLLFDGKLLATYHEYVPEYSDDLGNTWKPIKGSNPNATNLLNAVQAGKAYLSDQDGVYSRWDDRALDFFALPDEAEVDFLPVGDELYIWVLTRMDGC